jgi:phosphoglucomutase
LIQYLDSEIDPAFIQSSIANVSFGTPKVTKEKLKIVFTSLDGIFITLVPKMLSQASYTDLHFVARQAEPAGDFLGLSPRIRKS